jgi:putative transposase
MIGLPRSTYYRRAAPPLASSADRPGVDRDDALREAITAVRQTHPAYGYRRVTHALRRTGLLVNHKRVQRVMRTLLAPPMPRRRSWMVAEPDAVTGSWYPNLRADCIPTGPDQLWVADMTYLRVGSDAAFLAVLLDAWSRKVIGYALGPMLDARLPLAALDAALDTRTPAPGCVHHSDRGSQYASRRYRERLTAAGLRGSMSRAGNPYDNAHVESFMKTIKHEEIYLRSYRTMTDLMVQLPVYLEQTYNGTRLHSALAYLSPDEYERAVHPTPMEVK